MDLVSVDLLLDLGLAAYSFYCFSKCLEYVSGSLTLSGLVSVAEPIPMLDSVCSSSIGYGSVFNHLLKFFNVKDYLLTDSNS